MAAKLPSVDAATSASENALADEVIRSLKVAGACIIRHLYGEETMKKLDGEIKPYLTEVGNTTCKLYHIIPKMSLQNVVFNFVASYGQTSKRMS